MACKVSGTAFITGGGNGIGKTTAFTLAQNGIEALSLLDVNEALLQRTKNELATSHPNVAVEITVGDVSKEACVDEAVCRTVERFGRIDISVHCAGIVGQPSATHELTAAEWQRVIDINQTGVLLCQKAVIRQMLTQESRGLRLGRGTIVNMASMFGVVAPGGWSGLSAYTASKHAVVAFSKMDAKAYIQQEIRINAICPGYTDTDLIRTYWDAGFMEPDAQRVAIGRRAQPEEIADALLFLASPMSSYMVGSALVVDGGYTA
ncbi:SDR family NAD(P)-dependent oxidoreductase [Aspergillus neoniger CBS 115656]|uniref:Short chain dehydrogenase/ reductase n=1 Tax=Aspergillus neoniger (strain CBS 115656) TaxID=1448310 RepID=A0A318YV76_ASPNB|nr:short chain dehydrogenase/ reductase [Aspergillus neoniger CBS 115656]PYH31778.1 short chain dehydrogenase/ reductase [Aspergillus neoniger CBS 115656]